MNGLIVTHNNKTIICAIPKGTICVRISNKENPFCVSIDGIDQNLLSYIWYKATFKKGDILTIRYAEVSEKQINRPIEKFHADDINWQNKQLLLRYHQLKAQLKL